MYVAVLTVSLPKFIAVGGILFADGRPKVSELSHTSYEVFAILAIFLTIHLEDARLLKLRSFSS